jgi:hypothetical protein
VEAMASDLVLVDILLFETRYGHPGKARNVP